MTSPHHSSFLTPLRALILIGVLVFADAEQGLARAGGADPTGGEGQRSSSQQLRTTLDSQLGELTNAFFRVKMFLDSPDASDQQTVSDIAYLRSCFGKSSTCHGEVNAVIAEVRKKFKQTPNYVPGDCPSTIAHETTDMSITPSLDLCVSEKLGRYPPREMRRQVLSLLAHEIVHGLGFGETEARAMQDWFIENRAVVQPALSFRAKFDSMSSGPLTGLRILARDLDFQPISVERLCIFAGELALNVHKMNDLYSSADDDDALIVVPAYPIRQLGKQADEQILALVVPYCIQKKPIGDGTEYLAKLQRVAKTFEGLRAYLDVYSRSPLSAQPLEPWPGIQASLSLLVAEKDLMPATGKGGSRLTCKVCGEETEHEIGEHGDWLPLGELTTGVSIETQIKGIRFRKGGALGVVMFPWTKCGDSNCGDKYVVRVTSSNADVTFDKVLPWNSHFPMKVLGAEHQFRSVFQFQKRNDAGKLENIGSAIEVVCEDKD